MENVFIERDAADVQAVALKAYARIASAWSLTLREAAELADLPASTLKRAKKQDYADDLTRDQMLCLSALTGLYQARELYFNPPISRQWVKLPNQGPEFAGQRPIDAMIAGGLPKILRVRRYVDALHGGYHPTGLPA